MTFKILNNGSHEGWPDPIASFVDWDAFTDQRKINMGTALQPLIRYPLVITVEDNHQEEAPPGLTDFFRTTDFRIVSNKLKNALKLYAKDIEFVPVILQYNGKLIEHQYSILNPLRCIQGLDRSFSVFTELEGFIISIDKLVLDESKFEGIDWAILDVSSAPIVSEAVQKTMQDSGCIGFQFTEISDFTL